MKKRDSDCTQPGGARGGRGAPGGNAGYLGALDGSSRAARLRTIPHSGVGTSSSWCRHHLQIGALAQGALGAEPVKGYSSPFFGALRFCAHRASFAFFVRALRCSGVIEAHHFLVSLLWTSPYRFASSSPNASVNVDVRIRSSFA